jgi:hypothetical protein
MHTVQLADASMRWSWMEDLSMCVAVQMSRIDKNERDSQEAEHPSGRKWFLQSIAVDRFPDSNHRPSTPHKSFTTSLILTRKRLVFIDTSDTGGRINLSVTSPNAEKVKIKSRRANRQPHTAVKKEKQTETIDGSCGKNRPCVHTAMTRSWYGSIDCSRIFHVFIRMRLLHIHMPFRYLWLWQTKTEMYKIWNVLGLVAAVTCDISQFSMEHPVSLWRVIVKIARCLPRLLQHN